MTTQFVRKTDDTVRESIEMTDELWDYPQITDLSAVVFMIDGMLGVEHADDMRELLPSAAGFAKVGDDVGIDISEARSLIDIRRMFVKRHNEIVAAMRTVDNHPVHPEAIKRIPSTS